MAITNMGPMVKFYEGVFDIHFTSQELEGHTLHNGEWDRFKLLFCPAELAGIDASQNRHQFDVEVPDLDACVQKVLDMGGTLIGDIVVNEFGKQVGIRDCDGNSMTLIQSATAKS